MQSYESIIKQSNQLWIHNYKWRPIHEFIISKSMTWTKIKKFIHKQINNTYLLEILHHLAIGEGCSTKPWVVCYTYSLYNGGHPWVRAINPQVKIIWLDSSFSYTTQFLEFIVQFPLQKSQSTSLSSPFILHNPMNGIPFFAK
jgi:hypothetical protein